MTLLFATIDIGTNTVSTQLGEIRGPGDFEVVATSGDATRLGEGVDRTGALGLAAMERTLAELRRSRERLAAEQVAEVEVVGTSALRDAANCDELARRVAAETGWSLRVLSPEEEANYSFHSACTALGIEESVLVADLGGGSLELIWGRNGEVEDWVSIPLGSVRLTERLVHTDPISDGELAGLVQAIDAELTKVSPPFTADGLVGMAGTFLTLITVDHGLPAHAPERHGRWLTSAAVRSQVETYGKLAVADRRAIPGMEVERADIILAGAVIVERVMARFGFDRAQVSAYGLSYGLLAERAATFV